jgi:phenylacetate-CoA ligase
VLFERYNALLERLVLPVGDALTGARYMANLRALRRCTEGGEAAIQSYRNERLKAVLSAATVRSPYYAQLGIGKGKDPEEWLSRFPILDKATIRHEKDRLLTQPKAGLIKNSTSGSTGVQTEVWVSKKEQSVYRAAQTLWWEWAGYRIGHPILQTGLATSRSLEKKVKDFLFRTYYLFAFGLEQGQLKAALHWAAPKNAVLGGYASSLYVLSQMAGESDIPIRFKTAISWGDKLFDHYRRNIEQVFGCRVFETYGTGEGLMIAAQKDLQYMYIMEPCVYLELVDEQGNAVRDGEIGQVVVTSLIHEAMPLIRYKPGDLAIRLPIEKYPSRRELCLPLLQRVIGRETDIVKTPSGKRLIVHSFTGVLEYFPEIRQFCVVQENLEGVTIEYIPGEGFSDSVLDRVKAQLAHLIGEPFALHFKAVPEIPPTPSGKPQIIISRMA